MWLTGTTKFAIADARKFVSFIDTANWEIQDGFGKYQNPKKKQEDTTNHFPSSLLAIRMSFCSMILLFIHFVFISFFFFSPIVWNSRLL